MSLPHSRPFFSLAIIFSSQHFHFTLSFILHNFLLLHQSFAALAFASPLPLLPLPKLTATLSSLLQQLTLASFFLSYPFLLLGTIPILSTLLFFFTIPFLFLNEEFYFSFLFLVKALQYHDDYIISSRSYLDHLWCPNLPPRHLHLDPPSQGRPSTLLPLLHVHLAATSRPPNSPLPVLPRTLIVSPLAACLPSQLDSHNLLRTHRYF